MANLEENALAQNAERNLDNRSIREMMMNAQQYPDTINYKYMYTSGALDSKSFNSPEIQTIYNRVLNGAHGDKAAWNDYAKRRGFPAIN